VSSKRNIAKYPFIDLGIFHEARVAIKVIKAVKKTRGALIPSMPRK